jgi:hypothetical protein
VVFALAALACGAAPSPRADWPPLAKRWFERAEKSYHQADIEDAALAIDNALRVEPRREEIRMLAARIALAELEYDRAIQHLQGFQSTDARGIRGRALWYAGRIEQAADELEALLTDPEVRDPWATSVAKLARRGAGRTPFSMSGGLVAVSEMPQAGSTALIVPLEINGEQALALIATGVPEAVIDSGPGGAGEPSWISLRFAERVEVKDVPALAQDLSGISRQLNAPIKMLMGVNLLRHLHATVDFTGRQFVVRTYEPPPPPNATTVKLSYIRGGGMLMRASMGIEQTAASASLLVETSMPFAVALDEAGWKKAGVAVTSLKAVPGAGGLRAGMLPVLRLGAFEVPEVPGVFGAPVEEIEKGLNMDLDGFVGSMLLAAFRVTLFDGGRSMWLEDLPMEAVRSRAPQPPRPTGGPGAAPPAPSPTPPPGASAPQLTPPAAPPANAGPGAAPNPGVNSGAGAVKAPRKPGP